MDCNNCHFIESEEELRRICRDRINEREILLNALMRIEDLPYTVKEYKDGAWRFRDYTEVVREIAHEALARVWSAPANEGQGVPAQIINTEDKSNNTELTLESRGASGAAGPEI